MVLIAVRATVSVDSSDSNVRNGVITLLELTSVCRFWLMTAADAATCLVAGLAPAVVCIVSTISAASVGLVEPYPRLVFKGMRPLPQLQVEEEAGDLAWPEDWQGGKFRVTRIV